MIDLILSWVSIHVLSFVFPLTRPYIKLGSYTWTLICILAMANLILRWVHSLSFAFINFLYGPLFSLRWNDEDGANLTFNHNQPCIVIIITFGQCQPCTCLWGKCPKSWVVYTQLSFVIYHHVILFILNNWICLRVLINRCIFLCLGLLLLSTIVLRFTLSLKVVLLLVEFSSSITLP